MNNVKRAKPIFSAITMKNQIKTTLQVSNHQPNTIKKVEIIFVMEKPEANRLAWIFFVFFFFDKHDKRQENE